MTLYQYMIHQVLIVTWLDVTKAKLESCNLFFNTNKQLQQQIVDLGINALIYYCTIKIYTFQCMRT